MALGPEYPVDVPAYMSDRMSYISHSGNPYVRGDPCVQTQDSSRIQMLVSKPPWPPLVVRGHLHAIFLPVTKFHGDYKRRDGIILMFTMTFEATVNLAPAKPMCLLLIKNLTSSNIAIELLSTLSKIVSIPVRELGTSLGKSHNWKSYSVNPESGSPTSNGSMSGYVHFVVYNPRYVYFLILFHLSQYTFWKWVPFCCLISFFLIPQPCTISSLQGC